MKGKNIKVRALSHTEKFDKKQELIVQIEKAMEECLDQEEPVRFDFDGQRSENVTRAAEELSRVAGRQQRAVAAAAPQGRSVRRDDAGVRPAGEAARADGRGAGRRRRRADAAVVRSLRK